MVAAAFPPVVPRKHHRKTAPSTPNAPSHRRGFVEVVSGYLATTSDQVLVRLVQLILECVINNA